MKQGKGYSIFNTETGEINYKNLTKERDFIDLNVNDDKLKLSIERINKECDERCKYFNSKGKYIEDSQAFLFKINERISPCNESYSLA